MRAAVTVAYRAPLEIREIDAPACPEDGVVLRVLACGICRSDHHGWCGEIPRVKTPVVQGHEYCGEVVEAGPRASFAAGDRLVAPFILACGTCAACRAGEQNVCAAQMTPGFDSPGAFAEFIAVPRDHNLSRLPDGIAPALAAGLGCRVTTAWHALTGRAALKPGEWLAVHGTGGVGLSAMLLGRALGARVVVVDVVAEKLAHARQLGADAAVDAREGRTAEAIRDLTGGGAHVSIEALGNAAVANASLQCLRPLGRHVQVGMPVGEAAVMDLDMRPVYAGNLALYGSRGMPARAYPTLFALIAGGHVDLSPLIAREVGLEDVTAELRVFDAPAPPGVAVVTRFGA